MTIFKLICGTLFCIACSIAVTACGEDEPSNPNEEDPWETEQPSTSEPSGPSDSKIRALINEHVSVSASYSEWTWHFHIESSLHKALPDADVQFGIGHGNVYGTTSISVEDEAYAFSSYTRGDTRIMDFDNPFWFYWVFGQETTEQTKQIWVECSMYYASYFFLKDKGESQWTDDEKNTWQRLKSMLRPYEQEADYYYQPSVGVLIDSKFYSIATYKRD